MTRFTLRAERVLLRDWQEKDRTPFAALNADPMVMEFFPSVLTRLESDALVDRFSISTEDLGFRPWAVELVEGATFIGFVGLHAVPSQIPCAPAVEVGWRLARPFWGNGYATEAAAAAIRYGFEEIGLDEIVSFTSVLNLRSRRVMDRLGMTRDPIDDFDHPGVPEGHPLRPHLLYRLAGPYAARTTAAT